MPQPEAISHFTRMEDGTREDYELIERAQEPFVRALPERILAHLRLLDDSFGGLRVAAFESRRAQHEVFHPLSVA